MSIDIRIDSYDIVDMDERLDRAFDIRNGWGTEAVGDDNIMLTENMGRFPQGSIHAVMQTQQAQIEDQQALIEDQRAQIDRHDKDLEKIIPLLGLFIAFFISIGIFILDIYGII